MLPRVFASAQLNGLDFEGVFDHGRAKLAENVVSETIDVGFWTTPVILSKLERSNAASTCVAAMQTVPLITDGPKYNGVIEVCALLRVGLHRSEQGLHFFLEFHLTNNDGKRFFKCKHLLVKQDNFGVAGISFGRLRRFACAQARPN